ncbi:MAG: hypothetical protein A3H93_11535 [Rhodocyclales bacterium RIFCSPLOWO2_02_FULL_63_24]|nr:MAG: hypothetical protein A3H93_11535 [Rhodocyclales bacterium RIFCSPLOWO2_02_FULL_63_24]
MAARCSGFLSPIGPCEQFQDCNSRQRGNGDFDSGAYLNTHGGSQGIAKARNVHQHGHVRRPGYGVGAGFNSTERNQIDFVLVLQAFRTEMQAVGHMFRLLEIGVGQQGCLDRCELIPVVQRKGEIHIGGRTPGRQSMHVFEQDDARHRTNQKYRKAQCF